ncbi:hypothetical protein PT974_12551 [Cladobotryum mycophilum]|uniref:Uncharacterized protein n=1 Tax=Cladobotryum mycophilum TaxID=491253 RepID=A0ABR0S994_9HYPO
MKSIVAALILLVSIAVAAPMPQVQTEEVSSSTGCAANAMRPSPDGTASPNCLF